MTEKEEYGRRMQERFDALKAKIDMLKAKADKAKVELRVEYHEYLEDLRTKQKVLKDRMEELRLAGDTAWTDLKGGIERAWEDLGEAIKSASSRFK